MPVHLQMGWTEASFAYKTRSVLVHFPTAECGDGLLHFRGESLKVITCKTKLWVAAGDCYRLVVMSGKPKGRGLLFPFAQTCFNLGRWVRYGGEQ